MAYKDLSASERLVATHVAIMRDPEFTLLGGITQIGKNIVDPNCPTAATNGYDKRYGEAFIMGLTQKQLRYLVAHECMHIAYRHCMEFSEIVKKYPSESNQAMDHRVNLDLEKMDGGRGFIERPTDPAPLADPKYKDHSWLEILKDLLNSKGKSKQPQGGQGGNGNGKPEAGTLDEHEPGEVLPEKEAADLKQKIQDAVNQGGIMQTKLRGTGKGGANLTGFQERKTDWRTPLRRFISEVVSGDEQSRFSPPSKRFLPLQILMPSHFSEATGELIVAVDTSGSMTGVLPLVFGEVARICQQVVPESVRVIWWSDGIEGVQVFKPKDYAAIAKLMAPRGGGGTTVSCVARYIAEKKLKPKATIVLTDGYVESRYETPPGPLLWGVVDHSGWVPLRGKALHLQSLAM